MRVLTHVPTTRRRAAAVRSALALVGLLAIGAPATASAAVPDSILYFTDSVPGEPDAVAALVQNATSTNGEDPLLEVTRSGASIGTVAYEQGSYIRKELPDLQPGDHARVLGRTSGTVYAEATYDGRPTFSTPVCNSTPFTISGSRTPGATMHRLAVRSAGTDGDGGPYGAGANHKATFTYGAQGPGDLFVGQFAYLPMAGQIFQGLETYPAGTFVVQHFVERVVPACSVAVPVKVDTPGRPGAEPGPSNPGPGGTAKAGPKVLVLKAIKLAKKTHLTDLTKAGIAIELRSDRPGTLALKLAVRTTTGKGKKLQTKTDTVGQLRTQLAANRTAKLKLKADRKKLALLVKLAKKKGVKLVVSGTVTDVAGVATAIPPSTLSLPKS